MEDNQNCPYDTTFNTVDVVPISIGIACTNASCSYSDDIITITVNGGTEITLVLSGSEVV